MAPKSPASNLEDAVRDYIAGEGCDLVAARHHIGANRLKTALVERGVWRTGSDRYRHRSEKLTRQALADERLPVEEIAARYQAGESEKHLAESYQVSRNVIRLRLEAAGVPIRGRAEANKAMMGELSEAEKAQRISAAHAAIRGRAANPDRLAKAAKTREGLMLNVSEAEMQMVRWLRRRGCTGVATQTAVGQYNIDITTGSVAVEIFGGGWHAYGSHRKRAAKRLGKILDEGWNLMIVWVDRNRYPLSVEAADKVAAFVELTRRDPSIRGQYRVIWGDGEEAAVDGFDLDDLSVKPARRGRLS